MTPSARWIAVFVAGLFVACHSRSEHAKHPCPRAQLIWPFSVFQPLKLGEPVPPERVAFTLIEVPIMDPVEFDGSHIEAVGTCQDLSVDYTSDGAMHYQLDPSIRRAFDPGKPCDEIVGDYYGPNDPDRDLNLPLLPFFQHPTKNSNVAACVDVKGRRWVGGGTRQGNDGVGCEVTIFHDGLRNITDAFHYCSSMRILADLEIPPLPGFKNKPVVPSD